MKHLRLFTLCLCLCDVFGDDGDEVKSVSVMEGDSVTLHTDLTHIQTDDRIKWIYGPKETHIAEIYKKMNVKFLYEDDGRFRDRLKTDSQTGSLTITNIRITNSGLYKLKMTRNRETSYKRFNLTVYSPLSVPVISRNSSECSSSSDKCVVLCSVCNVTHVSLSWYKGMSLLSSISVSDLNIRLSLPLEVEYHHTNTYTCVVNNPITNQTQHLHIHDVCGSCPGSKDDLSIVMAVVAFILLCIAAVLTAVLVGFCKEKNKGGTPDKDTGSALLTENPNKDISSSVVNDKS